MAGGSDTRERLLQAALDQIEAGGEKAVRVREVAAAVGVTVPSLYHFFGSRDGLVHHAQARRFEAGLARMGLALAESLSAATSRDEFRDALRGYLEGILDRRNAPNRQARTSVITSAFHDPDLARLVVETQAAAVDRVAQMFAPAQAAGWIAPDVDVRSVILWAIVQINGFALLELDKDGRSDAGFQRLFVDSVMGAFGLG